MSAPAVFSGPRGPSAPAPPRGARVRGLLGFLAAMDANVPVDGDWMLEAARSAETLGRIMGMEAAGIPEARAFFGLLYPFRFVEMPLIFILACGAYASVARNPFAYYGAMALMGVTLWAYCVTVACVFKFLWGALLLLF